ncbi:DUF7010 family protein [Jeotgalibaca sp. A122]|uniref:DUF7010 family protein n=1 Tax=Jeotgalibaca sp. A122 TaxID=3457322 RepID=UPI003FD544D7
MGNLLLQLSETNYGGAPFLFAYGLTWIICGVLWTKLKPAPAALATLFQGMVALPFALLLMGLIGAFKDRPGLGILNDLVIIVAMSQLLVLPLLVAFFRKKNYTLIPFVFSAAGAVHFLMYAWLYQTLVYIVMPVMIALVLSVTYADTTKAASKACYMTGILLLLSASYLLFM